MCLDHFKLTASISKGYTQDVCPVSHRSLVAAMTQLSALAQSEVVTAFEAFGLSSARDLAGLSEVLLLVRFVWSEASCISLCPPISAMA